MQPPCATLIDIRKANALLARRGQVLGTAPPRLEDGDLPAALRRFRETVPVCDRLAYRGMFSQAIAGPGPFKGIGFSLSSGTSGAPLLSAKRVQINPKGESLALSTLRSVAESVALRDTDTVANLFTAGNFSFLHEDINKLLAKLSCNIVPLGNLGDLGNLEAILPILAQLRVNVLFGTPSSVFAFARCASASGLSFGIERIVFTGEKFSLPRREFVRGLWPGARIFGLYGQSEIGFLGISTPECGMDSYHVIDESLFFLEDDEEHGLLVTSYDESHVLPILRYSVADEVELHARCSCGHAGTIIRVAARRDEAFNYCGNLVNAKALMDLLAREVPLPGCEAQIVLRQTGELKDQLQVNIHPLEGQAIDTERIAGVIGSLPDLAEAVRMNTGEVVVRQVAFSDLYQSRNQKTKTLCDLRT